MSRWFRFYDEALNDPKVQRLGGDLFKSWVNLLCLASKNGGVLPPVADISYALRFNEAKVGSILADLVTRGLIDKIGDSEMRPHNWNGRQHQSDSSTERVRAFRKRHETVSVTPQNRTEQITEQSRAEDARGARRKGTRISEDWKPTSDGQTFATSCGLSNADIARETERMRNHFLSKSGAGGVKLDWDATWRNWALKAAEILGRAPKLNGSSDEKQMVFVSDDSPEGEAWKAHEIATRGKIGPRKNGGWWRETKWPPGHEPTTEAA